MTGTWQFLRNGSDIRGLAEPSETDPATLTPEVMHALGRAFVLWLAGRLQRSPEDLVVAVGRDSRRSGLSLSRAMLAGMLAERTRVLDFGLASTPAMFVSTRLADPRCDGAVILTASHLPPDRNGCKFFTAAGGLDVDDIRMLLELASRLTVESNPWAVAMGTVRERLVVSDFMSVYAEDLVSEIRKRADFALDPMRPLAGLHVIVDAANGAGGFFVDRVLQPLGADTVGSRCLRPDGDFPCHIPNPEHPEAMRLLREAVLDMEAHLGIAFDPDVDRAAIVDHKGQVINRNRLLALMASLVLREHPGSTIVTDSVTSEGLTEFIEQTLGGRHHRFRRGYRNVIREAMRLNAEGEECWLAMETSGHAALRQNGFLDDGAYLVALLLVELARARQQGGDITDGIAALREPIEAYEYRLRLPKDGFAERGQVILQELSEILPQESDWRLASDNHEGLRVRCPGPSEQGWWLLRLSLHDPVLPLNIESDVAGGAWVIARRLLRYLRRWADLDCGELDQACARIENRESARIPPSI